MKKYGVENFTYEVIDFAFDQWQADCLEKNYIHQYDSRNKEHGYNIAPGGDHAWNTGLPKEQQPMYGKKQSEYQKKRMTEVHGGKVVIISQEQREKLSLANIGKKHSEESYNKMTQSRMNSINGYDHTEEAKQKMSISHVGIHVGEKSPRAKLTWDIVRLIRQDYKSGASILNIAKKHGTKETTTYDICKNRTWKE